MARTISTAEFMRIARGHRVRTLGLNVSFRIDASDRVRTFDYALMLPVQWPGATSQEPRPAALEDVIGIDPSCWFDDGYRLPVDDWDFLANCRRFSSSEERKGTAFERVHGFFDLLQRMEDAGFEKAITGSGVQAILQWAQITMQAAEDPAFRRQADSALGHAGSTPEPASSPGGGGAVGDVRYILYGLVASTDDAINPDEVFMSPDPDGEPQVYMFVWDRRDDADAFINAQGARGSAFARPVRMGDLITFASRVGAWFAINPDPMGRTKTISEPFSMSFEID